MRMAHILATPFRLLLCSFCANESEVAVAAAVELGVTWSERLDESLRRASGGVSGVFSCGREDGGADIAHRRLLGFGLGRFMKGRKQKRCDPSECGQMGYLIISP